MADTRQLDLFEDSRNVLLNNDVLKALAAYDTDAATLAVTALHNVFPQHHDLPDHRQLIEQLSDFRRALQPNSLPNRHLQLTQTLLPLARQLFGSAQATIWARPL